MKNRSLLAGGVTLISVLTLLFVLVDVAAFIAIVIVAWHFIAKFW